MAMTRLLPSAHSGQTHLPSHHQAFFQEKVFVALKNVDAAFDLKGRITGPNNAYLGHIQLTGARCWLRGQGSGHLEPESGREAFEALHIQLQHSSPSGLSQAKLLAENLVETVQQQFYQWRESRNMMPTVSHPWQAPTSQIAGTTSRPAAQQPPLPLRSDVSLLSSPVPPVSLPISTGVFAMPPHPPPCQIVLPFDPVVSSLPPTTTQLIITDHSITGAPTQQQVVIFKQEPSPPSCPQVISRPFPSSSPPLVQETITTTTTTYYFPNSAPVTVFPDNSCQRPTVPCFTLPPLPVPPVPPVTYPLTMLPTPVPPPPPISTTSHHLITSAENRQSPAARMNRWDACPPVLYNPPPSCPPPVRAPGNASTLVAWSADFPHHQRPNATTASSLPGDHLRSKNGYGLDSASTSDLTSNGYTLKRGQNAVNSDGGSAEMNARMVMPPPARLPVVSSRRQAEEISAKRIKSASHSGVSFNKSQSAKLAAADKIVDAVIVKKTSALSSLAVAYNGNDNDE